MASNLGTRGSQTEQQKFSLRQTVGGVLRAKKRYDFRGPWQGFAPDVPHTRADPHYAAVMNNLVVRSGPSGEGEVLINDAGYVRVDDANLPLGDDAATTNDICIIDEFKLVDATGVPVTANSTSLMAVSAGDGSTAGSQQLWRISANGSSWVEVPGSGSAGHAEMSATINGDTATLHRQSMVDAASFPLGAAARDTAGAKAGAISTPAWVFTNNFDEVMVFPAGDSNQTDYEHLTDRFTAFKCISVETYKDRMYFLNTEEGGTRVRNKVRRSARGTCDPLETTAGAGSFTLEEFANGLKLLTLGDVLVAYFDDGIAFIRDTFNAAAPNSVQALAERRGILGTHAVADIPGIGHFGIYRDGWWMLDANGRFRELGVADFGSRAYKWKRNFYKNVDIDNGHRVHCTYDADQNWVRIVVPLANGSTEVWTYDVLNDRVYKDSYPVAPTVFGLSVVTSTDSETWADQVDGVDTWSAKVGSWDSLSAAEGDQFTLHGDVNGNIFFHSDNQINQDGNVPSWAYQSVDNNLGDAETLKRGDRLTLEHINSANSNSASLSITDGRSNTSTMSISLNQGNAGDIETGEAFFTGPTDENLSFQAAGTGAVQIRGIVAHTVERKSERSGT